MKSKLIIILVFAITTGTEAQTIYDNYLSFSWDYNLPLTNKNFISNGSSLGFQIGFRKKFDRFYVGADINNATYSEHTARQTLYADNSATTTDTYNYIYSYGFTLNGDYIFRPFKKFMPFVGLGIGANSFSYKTYYNIYTSGDSGLGALFRPQAGFLMKLGQDSKIAITGVVHYDYSTVESTIFNYSGFSAIGFRLGVALNLKSDK